MNQSVTDLNELNRRHEAGEVSDGEYEIRKARIIRSGSRTWSTATITLVTVLVFLAVLFVIGRMAAGMG